MGLLHKGRSYSLDLLKKVIKFKEKEKSARVAVKKLAIRWIFSFFVKGDDDLSFYGDVCPITNLNYHCYEKAKC